MNPRATIQLLGRLARINPGKTDVEIVTLSEMTSKALAEALTDFGNLFRDAPKVVIRNGADEILHSRLRWNESDLYDSPQDFVQARQDLASSTIPFWSNSMIDLAKQTTAYAAKNDGALPAPTGPTRSLYNKIVLASKSQEFLNRLSGPLRGKILEMPHSPSTAFEIEARLNAYFLTGFEPFPTKKGDVAPEIASIRIDLDKAIDKGFLDTEKLSLIARERVLDYYAEKNINLQRIEDSLMDFYETFKILPGHSHKLPPDAPRPSPLVEQFINARFEKALHENTLDPSRCSHDVGELIVKYIDDIANLESALQAANKDFEKLHIFINTKKRVPTPYGPPYEVELFKLLQTEIRRPKASNAAEESITAEDWGLIIDSFVYREWVSQRKGRRPGRGSNKK